MLYAGLDLGRKRLDFHLLDAEGATVERGASPPDADGLQHLSARVARHGEPISAAIESMNGARFVHDRLELHGWQVEIADAQKVKGLAPPACTTDRIDAWVLAELARRDLVPAIWLPDPRGAPSASGCAGSSTLSHRSSLKQRVYAVLLTHGKPCPVSDLFGLRGRQLLAGLGLPEPWQGTVEASLRLIDELEHEIGDCEAELRRLGADHQYVPLLLTVPGIGWVLAYTIAAEIGDIARFASPRKLAGYSGLCPRVYQSGERDLRGPLSKQRPRYVAQVCGKDEVRAPLGFRLDLAFFVVPASHVPDVPVVPRFGFCGLRSVSAGQHCGALGRGVPTPAGRAPTRQRASEA